MKLTLPAGKGIVALSGGADSVALLRLILEQRRDIFALHCNFHLRAQESNRDEAFVRKLCDTLGVELKVRHFDTCNYAREKGVSLEMAARELRYCWFEQERVALGCEWIAVAHHREDQAETVLLNLIRGTGLRGLGGMQAINGHIVRPLLDISKSDLLGYLAAIGQTYVTDSTNLRRDAQRNRLRLDVIPHLLSINPKMVEHICQTAALVRSWVQPDEGSNFQTDKSVCPVGMPPYTLASLYSWLHPLGFTQSQQRDILRDIHGPSGAVYESTTHRLLRDRGRLILEEKHIPSLPIVRQEVITTDCALDFLRTQPLDAQHAYLDADLLSYPLKHRFVQKGDIFCPYGMKGHRLISDFMTDRKLNVFEKERQSVMLSQNDIVWLVGLRSDNRYRVKAETRRILILTLQD